MRFYAEQSMRKAIDEIKALPKCLADGNVDVLFDNSQFKLAVGQTVCDSNCQSLPIVIVPCLLGR